MTAVLRNPPSKILEQLWQLRIDVLSGRGSPDQCSAVGVVEARIVLHELEEAARSP
jgi:hypothetical protein